MRQNIRENRVALREIERWKSAEVTLNVCLNADLYKRVKLHKAEKSTTGKK